MLLFQEIIMLIEFRFVKDISVIRTPSARPRGEVFMQCQKNIQLFHESAKTLQKRKLQQAFASLLDRFSVVFSIYFLSGLKSGGGQS